MPKHVNLDQEIIVSKGRRALKDFANFLLSSLAAFLLFIVAAYPIAKNTSGYQAIQSESQTSLATIRAIGEESGLAKKNVNGEYLSEYALFERYAFKHIHLSFDRYKADFESHGFHSINDPYNQPILSADNDDLQKYYTVFAVNRGLIDVPNPVEHYFNQIIDLGKHNNIFVRSDDTGTILLNPHFDNDGETQNFGVMLYREFYDDDKGACRKAVHDFYFEYYDKAEAMLYDIPEYKEATDSYAEATKKTSLINGLLIIGCYLLSGAATFVLPTCLNKKFSSLSDRLMLTELYDKDGNEVGGLKRIGYSFIKMLLAMFFIGIPFYIGYGLNILTAPLFTFGNFIIPFGGFLLLPLALWLVNAITIFFSGKENSTLLDQLFGLRYVDGRYNEERKNKK